jgi:hypothetical protein
MARFNIGDKVICVNDTFRGFGNTPIIKKGKIYDVLDVQFCVKCGDQKIDVGTRYTERGGADICECLNCGHINQIVINTPLNSNRFLKLDEHTIATLIESEEYELCTIVESELVEK